MSREKLHDRIVHALGCEITRGQYAPDQVIPIENALAERFGVSRVVVREAIKILAAKGLLEVRTRTGTRVTPRQEWNLLDPQVIAWRSAPLARTGEPDRKLIVDLIELRRIVEPAAARLAALRAKPDDIAALRAAFARVAAAVDGDGDYTVADLAFHNAVLLAGRNQFVIQLRTALAETLKTSIALTSRDPGRKRQLLPLHEDMLRGIEERDPEAAAGASERLIALAAGEIAHAYGDELDYAG